MLQGLVSGPGVLVIFLVAMIKYSDKSNLKEKGFILVHSRRAQSITEVKSWQQELEGACLIKFILRSLPLSSPHSLHRV